MTSWNTARREQAKRVIVAHVMVSELVGCVTQRRDGTRVLRDGTVRESKGLANDILLESVVDQGFRHHQLCGCQRAQAERFTLRVDDISSFLC